MCAQLHMSLVYNMYMYKLQHVPCLMSSCGRPGFMEPWRVWGRQRYGFILSVSAFVLSAERNSEKYWLIRRFITRKTIWNLF